MHIKGVKQMNTFLVGGAVRDMLLGLEHKDKDFVVVGSTPAEMEARGFKQVGADFPVFLCPDTKDEFALARTERKTGAGHTAFVCDASPEVTLEEDLMRRDLTINAMALDDEGEIVDPFDGQEDLANGMLRHVSPAFAEDPLRVLRVARFAARFPTFRVAAETMLLMTELVKAGEVDTLTPERVWQEMNKALGEAKPTRFFEVLRDCGALKVLLPEVDALRGVPQPALHHPEVDTFVHVMLALDEAVKMDCDLDVRFAVLVHDLGKGLSPADMLPSHHGHEKGGVPLVEAVCDRLKVPRATRRLALAVCEHHLRCHKILDSRPGKVFKLLMALDGLRRPEMVEKFAQACEADARGRTGLEDRHYPQADMLRRALPLVKAVSAKPLVERGFTGLKLAKMLEQERVRALINL
jgi:tRNA nucleotidyltransferase (CCA-adding enzyme)